METGFYKFSFEQLKEIFSQQGFTRSFEDVVFCASNLHKERLRKVQKNVKKLHSSLRTYLGLRSSYENVFCDYKLTRSELSLKLQVSMENLTDLKIAPGPTFSKIRFCDKSQLLKRIVHDFDYDDSACIVTENSTLEPVGERIFLAKSKMVHQFDYLLSDIRHKYISVAIGDKPEPTKEYAISVYQKWYLRKLLRKLITHQRSFDAEKSKNSGEERAAKIIQKHKVKFYMDPDRMWEIVNNNDIYPRRFKFIGFLRSICKGTKPRHVESYHGYRSMRASLEFRHLSCKFGIYPKVVNLIAQKAAIRRFVKICKKKLADRKPEVEMSPKEQLETELEKMFLVMWPEFPDAKNRIFKKLTYNTMANTFPKLNENDYPILGKYIIESKKWGKREIKRDGVRSVNEIKALVKSLGAKTDYSNISVEVEEKVAVKTYDREFHWQERFDSPFFG